MRRETLAAASSALPASRTPQDRIQALARSRRAMPGPFRHPPHRTRPGPKSDFCGLQLCLRALPTPVCLSQEPPCPAQPQACSRRQNPFADCAGPCRLRGAGAPIVVARRRFVGSDPAGGRTKKARPLPAGLSIEQGLEARGLRRRERSAGSGSLRCAAVRTCAKARWRPIQPELKPTRWLRRPPKRG